MMKRMTANATIRPTATTDQGELRLPPFAQTNRYGRTYRGRPVERTQRVQLQGVSVPRRCELGRPSLGSRVILHLDTGNEHAEEADASKKLELAILFHHDLLPDVAHSVEQGAQRTVPIATDLVGC
jgi:hypothetical protein